MLLAGGNLASRYVLLGAPNTAWVAGDKGPTVGHLGRRMLLQCQQ